MGQGRPAAVENVNTEIAEAIIGLDAEDQAFIDRTLIELDGTENKSRLGANAMLACRWPSPRRRGRGRPAAVPLLRRLQPHGDAGADDEHHQRRRPRQQQPVDIQECMIMPVGAESFREALRCGAEIFHAPGRRLTRRASHHRRRRGRLRPNVSGTDEALNLILKPSKRRLQRPARTCCSASTCAASEFYKDGMYVLEGEGLS